MQNYRYNEGEHILSVRLNLNADLLIINRKTDSILDWAASCGGVLKALTITIKFLLEFYNVYRIKSKLTSLFVKFLPSDNNDPKR